MIKNNFEGWDIARNCFPSHLATLVSPDTFQCENENQDNDALYAFHDNDFYNSNCAKPCSIIQYTGKLDY